MTAPGGNQVGHWEGVGCCSQVSGVVRVRWYKSDYSKCIFTLSKRIF